ncbi:hypothetical protein CRENBAI_003823 [Crenichthys baileyi]|uniref:Uncharacterized protein n=1 Tax=Crenichthys baileyi TaxID=28760 RepID=A0AAV9S219_9TELE
MRGRTPEARGLKGVSEGGWTARRPSPTDREFRRPAQRPSPVDPEFRWMAQQAGDIGAGNQQAGDVGAGDQHAGDVVADDLTAGGGTGRTHGGAQRRGAETAGTFGEAVEICGGTQQVERVQSLKPPWKKGLLTRPGLTKNSTPKDPDFARCSSPGSSPTLNRVS